MQVPHLLLEMPMQLALVAFAGATVFIKPRMHVDTVADGRLFLGFIFYLSYFLNASAWSELVVMVRFAIPG